MAERIEDRDIKEVNMTQKEVNINAKSLFSVSEDMTTVGADYAKVLIDVQCRVCTFVFIKRHPITKPSVNDGNLLLEGLHDEAFLEVKVPFETAFALSTYMNESLKNIRLDKTIGQAFGPNQMTL